MMTTNSYRKQAIRKRMRDANENYLTAARFVDELAEDMTFRSEYYWDEPLTEVMDEIYATMYFFGIKMRMGEPDLSEAFEDFMVGAHQDYYQSHFSAEWNLELQAVILKMDTMLQKVATDFRVTKEQVDGTVQEYMKLSSLNDYLCDRYDIVEE